MTQEQERALFVQYSKGRIARLDLGEALSRDLSFADALLKLHEYKLPLYRPPVDPNSSGVQLVKRLAQRASHG